MNLPQGIDCQRCHGPGQNHVNAALASRPAAEIKSLIVNPARLTAARRDEVCFQCHLEPTSLSLPAYVPVFGRSVFSYVPGQPLSAYIRYFDQAPGTGYMAVKFEFVSAPYRLRQSQCFRQSQGALTCIACHDPHEPDQQQSIARANAACINCHSESPCHDHGAGWRQTPHPAVRRVHIVPHARAAPVRCDSRHNHRSLHPAQSGKGPATPTVERNSANTPPYRGEVIPYYPRLPGAAATKDLYTGVAQVRSRANPDAGIRQLSNSIAAVQPVRAEFYVELADAYRHGGNSPAAIPYYRQATSRDPEYWPAWHGLGLALAATGDLNGSLEPLTRAVSLSGGDSSVVRSLASILTNLGMPNEALTALQNGVATEPDSADLRNDLGTVLLQAGDATAAEASLRDAVRLRPESAGNRTNLASLLVTRGKLDEAEFEFRAAIRIDPGSALAHLKLGEMLVASTQGIFGSAVAAPPSGLS